MKSSLVLQEAVIVFKTFHLIADRPAFSPNEVKRLHEAKALSEKKLRSLVKKASDPLIRESAGQYTLARRRVITEAIYLERLTILEAASDMSVNQMMQQLHGMATALEPLTELSSSVAMVIDTEASTARELATDLEDLEGAGMQREFKQKMVEFKKVFANMATMVKGLISVSDELMSGKLGEILKPVIAWSVKRKQKITSLLDTLMQYDVEVNKVAGQEGVPMKQGMFGRMFGKKPAAAEKTDTAAQFKRLFDDVVRSKAPGFAKVAQTFGADMMEKPLRSVVMAFRAFDDAVSNHLDLDMIFNMSKQSFGQALKGFFGGAAHGRVGVGMGGGAPG